MGKIYAISGAPSRSFEFSADYLIALDSMPSSDPSLRASASPIPFASSSGRPLIRPLTPRQRQAPQRAGYYETVWPSEHTDLWRSHAVSHAGLPADFKSSRLKVATAGLNLPVWGYTRAKNEVFAIGGSPATLNIFTQEIKHGGTSGGGHPASAADIAASASAASALATGDALRAHLEARTDDVPYVAQVDPFTMAVRLCYLTEGDTLNYTGGLLMHQNGFVYAVSRSTLYQVDPATMQVARSLALPRVGAGSQQYFTVYNGLQVLASGELVIKGFYFLNDAPVDGWLLLVDPEKLAIDLQQSHALSSARMAITQADDGSATLYQVNATQALRFRITDRGFVEDRAWTRSYRTADSGSTQASSQLLYGRIGQVVFADNTVFGATTPIQLYPQAMAVSQVPPGPLAGHDAFSVAEPGFNFMMVAGDPFERQLVVYYDPVNNLLSAHRVRPDGTLESLWNIDGKYKASASPAVCPDRDLLYIDDYRHDRDHFVILRLSTGEELGRVPLDARLPTIGTIFLGLNEDVYILNSEAGTPHGKISRIYVR